CPVPPRTSQHMSDTPPLPPHHPGRGQASAAAFLQLQTVSATLVLPPPGMVRCGSPDVARLHLVWGPVHGSCQLTLRTKPLREVPPCHSRRGTPCRRAPKPPSSLNRMR